MPWVRDTLHVNADVSRWVADVFKPDWGEGCREVRLKRRLAAGEKWPPPKPEPTPDPEAARRARDLEKTRREVLGALLSDDSGLDPISREQLARRAAWQREHGGNR